MLNDQVSNTEMRLPYCEYCGHSGGAFHTHHIHSSGAGGPDIRANKINLCPICHRRAQDYEIKPYELAILVARREKAKVRDVYGAIGLPVPENIEELEELAKTDKETPKTIEDLISMLIQTEQNSQEIRFLQGEIINELTSRNVKYSFIASQIGKSTAYIRTVHKTFIAFPTEEQRIPTLSWTHHKIAAFTDNPAQWIARAADEEMSTRQLREAILREEDQEAIVEDENKKALAQAEHVLAKVLEIIEKGGPAAAWLKAELQNLNNELMSS